MPRSPRAPKPKTDPDAIAGALPRGYGSPRPRPVSLASTSHTRSSRVQLPILKVSFAQGPLITEYLELVGRAQISKVNEVRTSFRPVVLNDKLRRYTEADTPERYQEMISNPKVREKRFDSEYCRLRDFCECLHFTSQQDNEVMLTFFGRLALEHIKNADVRDFFSAQMHDLLGRVLLFVDAVERWRVLATLTQHKKDVTTHQLAELLDQKHVGLQDAGVDLRIRQNLREEAAATWKSSGRRGLPDYYWLQAQIEKDLHERVVAEEERILIDLLRIYKLVGLVDLREDIVSADVSRLELLQAKTFWNRSGQIDHSAFRHCFTETCRTLQSDKRPNVPIPLIRDIVCLNLKIPWETFDYMVTQLAMAERADTIGLSQGRFDRRWGVRVGKTSYYYAAVRRAKPRN